MLFIKALHHLKIEVLNSNQFIWLILSQPRLKNLKNCKYKLVFLDIFGIKVKCFEFLYMEFWTELNCIRKSFLWRQILLLWIDCNNVHLWWASKNGNSPFESQWYFSVDLPKYLTWGKPKKANVNKKRTSGILLLIWFRIYGHLLRLARLY